MILNLKNSQNLIKPDLRKRVNSKQLPDKPAFKSMFANLKGVITL